MDSAGQSRDRRNVSCRLVSWQRGRPGGVNTGRDGSKSKHEIKEAITAFYTLENIRMINLEYWNGGQWVYVSEWGVEGMAWISLGGDDVNYRTVEADTGKVLTDKSL